MTDTEKLRLDIALVQRNMVRTRSQARDIIKRGKVRISGAVCAKASQLVAAEEPIKIDESEGIYVSRGAFKLKAALDAFHLCPNGRHCLDIGASTGGFTQLLLERAAAHVYAIDVGHDQLAPELQDNPNVSNLEGTDSRALTADIFQNPISAITADVSFISITKALQVPLTLAADGAWLAALIKPQFEVGRDAIGKGGIVRSDEDRRRAVEDVCDWINKQPGWRLLGTTPSPVTGQGGNQETMLAAIYSESNPAT